MIGLVVSSGEIVEENLVRKLVTSSDIVICADGGLDHLRELELIPDLVIGDLDSISRAGKIYIEEKSISIIRYPVMKDDTDNELAIDYLVDKGVRHIDFLGVTGSRYDHSLVNIMALRDLGKKNISSRIFTPKTTIHYCKGLLSLDRREGIYISIVPLSDDGIRISMEGFLYPLKEQAMDFGSSLGISNEIVKDKGLIRVLSGDCLVIESKD